MPHDAYLDEPDHQVEWTLRIEQLERAAKARDKAEREKRKARQMGG